METLTAPAHPTAHVDLSIGGMTCASCAARIEKRLNRLDGVSASVNYATESASVDVDPALADGHLLIATVEATGYTAHVRTPASALESDHTAAALRPRLVTAVVLGLPVVATGMVPALGFSGMGWWHLALSTPVATYAAWPFHRAAWAGLRHRTTTMDTLISLGVISSWLWSLVAVLRGDERTYFEVACGVTAFLLTGRTLEARAKRRSGAAMRALLELGAKEVAVLDDEGREHLAPVESLAVGTRFVVRPGEKVATDGVVEQGTSAVDASLLTGESVPVDVGPGDPVTGATVNVGGLLVVRATRVGADTALAQITRLVTEAQSGKAPVQRLADRVSSVFVPTVIGLSLVTLVGWLASGHRASDAFAAAVAVLIIACPCALGLATPTALLAGTGRGAQLGIVIRGPEVLESTRRVDTIVLDKTGTVTTGRMTLVGIHVAVGTTQQQALAMAAAVESGSEHPVARAVVAAMPTHPAVSGFASTRGLGVQGVVDGVEVLAGRPALLEQAGLSVPPDLLAALESEQALGRTTVTVGWEGSARGVLGVADVVKPSSRQAIDELTGLGLHPVLLTGDHARVARSIADQVGIADVQADVLPEGKVDVVRRLQAQGRVVAMVGDGVNDAAALAQADLGLAMGTGTDAAIEASDLTLVRGDLRAAADAIRLSRRTLATIKGNLAWAFGYNVAAIPLAAAGWLNPTIAGGAMACSSLFVVGNSLRLFRFRPMGGRDSQVAGTHR